MNRTQIYQAPKGTGKTKNGIVPMPIIVNGTNTHNSGDVAKQGLRVEGSFFIEKFVASLCLA